MLQQLVYSQYTLLLFNTTYTYERQVTANADTPINDRVKQSNDIMKACNDE